MMFGFHIDSPNPCSLSPLILVIDSPTWGRPLIVLSSSLRNGDVQGLKEVLIIYAWSTVNNILVFCNVVLCFLLLSLILLLKQQLYNCRTLHILSFIYYCMKVQQINDNALCNVTQSL